MFRRAPALKNIARLSIPCYITSRSLASSEVDLFLYTCTIDAESLHRYIEGGYHPISLGDYLKDGRYKVLHKLGWGGYSTVWAARDQMLEKAYVAVKVCVSEGRQDAENRELQVMQELASGHPSSEHVLRILDNFDEEGPNGIHKCLVLELLGPSVSDTIDARFSDGRLPGNIAKSIAKQALWGLDTLHQQKIGHGDFHTRNLAFTLPCMNHIPEEEFIEMLGKPEIGYVQRKDGKVLDHGMPEYIVRPASYRRRSFSPSNAIKIIDFGESFFATAPPETLHTPLPVRAPESVFGDRLDYRVDLWSIGCMLFELFVGQPPFDNFLITPPILVSQMREIVTDELPERWQEPWKAMANTIDVASSGTTLQAWLEEMYFDGERREDLTREDIVKLGQIIERLLRFEPSRRVPAREILGDPWLRE